MNTREILDKEDFIKKHKDIPGEKHGKLTLLVTKPIKMGENVPLEGSNRRNPIATRTMYNVKCDCGKETWVTISAWRLDKVKSCGKCVEPEIGKRYGKLTVIKEAPGRPRPHKNGRVYMRRFWLCKCDCGNETTVVQDSLTTYHTTSCGHCYEVDHSHIPQNVYLRLFIVAHNILDRCRNTAIQSFYLYGGRGIECKLGNTLSEIAVNLYKIPGYFEGAQLDRIDNNGHYELTNVRWVSAKENSNNNILHQRLDKSEVSLRLLPLSTFKKVCSFNNFNENDFVKYELGLVTTALANEPVYLFIHNDNIDDTDFYIKRILNFWTKWSGIVYTVHINTGVIIKDPVTGNETITYRTISSDLPEKYDNDNNKRK